MNDISAFVRKYKLYLMGLAVIVSLSIVFDIMGVMKENREYVDMQPTINKMYAIINNTEIGDVERADQLYNFKEYYAPKKYIYYTGIIDSIRLSRGEYQIELTTSVYYDVQCNVDQDQKEKIYALRKGQTVTIRGYFDEIFLDFEIEDCEVIMDNKKDNIQE